MDEATIKQMMVEYKQAVDKANFLEKEIKQAVISLGKGVYIDNVHCMLFNNKSMAILSIRTKLDDIFDEWSTIVYT